MWLAILADDFTGACDAAAPFASSRSTFVSLGAQVSDAEVIALDLNVRDHFDDEAHLATETAARRFAANQIFLKIDSTLRGPIAGLIEGALKGTHKEMAVIAPAFPEQGRLLHEGCLLIEGRRGPSLPDLPGMQRTALLGANFARSSHEVERAVEHARMRGAQRVIVDSDAADCLASVAEAWQKHPEWLLVGSAGLARRIAGAALNAPPDLPMGDGPVLVVAGSPAAATRAQLERLRPFVKDVVILSTPLAAERDVGEAAHAVADAAATWAKTQRPRAIVLVGGATGRAVCDRLNVQGIRLVGEVSPGIPCGFLIGGDWDGIPVVTKAGGFGLPVALLDVACALGVRSRPDA
jgi:uncharacterized protein YgbK (DUF1537 family)